MEIDQADVVAEVREVLDRYETALMTNDIPTLEAIFWDDPRTVRLGVGEILFGMEAIRRFRRAQTGGYQQRERLEIRITTYGRDFGVTNIVYRRIATGMIGRETKIFARLPDIGWRVVSAHVSLNPEGTPIER
ncbi:AtzH-like domain-containing protein [Elioraea rosea]|uniref:AtzH-like domain-containing protein n=1 Tax=Elioraea rosea TaxID=2492390 RepID=UPI001183BB96|nr:AtzH-like domain-containing protein [Elioraea rosea]